MSEFAKKTMMGYKEVSKAHSNSECTHVILTIDEYDKLLLKIEIAERDTKKAQYDAEQKVRSAQNSATATVDKANKEKELALEKMRQQLAAEQNKGAYWERLNANLLRIAKERANADRKLKPKKTHSGYVVTYSAEKEYRYRERRDTMSVMLWETVLQSPYSVDFTEEQVKVQTKELFEKDANDRWVIQRIGINALYGDSYELMLEDKDWADWQNYNVLLERRYRANYKTGYWELVFTHTKALGIVPEDMRP